MGLSDNRIVRSLSFFCRVGPRSLEREDLLDAIRCDTSKHITTSHHGFSITTAW